MTLAVSVASPFPVMADAPIRVMVVDDSVVVRGLISRWIDDEPGLEVVASLRTGRQAVDQLERADPDVVILDVEMPELDGLSALPLMLEKKRDLVVIMASTVTRRNAETSLKALALGAADYIPKPETSREVTTSAMFRCDLIDKVRQLGRQHQRNSESFIRTNAHAEPILEGRVAADVEPSFALAAPSIKLRPFPMVVPRVLLIGSSTGGPQALQILLSGLRPVLERAPVLITQHMPPTFTTILAEHLGRASGRSSREAVDGEPVQAGTIYLAPGGRHMRVRRNETPVIAIDDGAPINFCKPAVDPLFSSAASVWGNSILSVILTGMGHDGTEGAADVIAVGGSVIAQDEASSVIWGMPGSAARAGLCSAILPLDQMASRIVQLFLGDRA